MTTPAESSTPKTAGDDRNLVAVDANYPALTFEDRVNQFWNRNRKVVYGVIGLSLVLVLGKEGWDYLGRQKELEIEKTYAAATTTEQLKSFVAAHAGHSLAGIAQVRIADEAYTAGKSADAIAGYEKAVTILKGSPLAGRAQLGLAMAKIQAGKTAEGVAELKQLAGDANQLKGLRAEAAYDLASLASEAGNTADVTKYVDELMKIEPQSTWAQRGMMLRAMTPATPAPAAAAPAATENKEAAGMQIKLPGK